MQILSILVCDIQMTRRVNARADIFSLRVGGDAHIATFGIIESAGDFRKISSYCRDDVGIVPYALVLEAP